MRELAFIVDKQRLTRSPSCDFSNIVKGSSGYLTARFEFSSDWDDCNKAASFLYNGKEYAAALRDNACVIPSEALQGKFFKVCVVGAKNGYMVPTNTVIIRQE